MRISQFQGDISHDDMRAHTFNYVGLYERHEDLFQRMVLSEIFDKLSICGEKLSILENSDIVEEMAQMQIFLSHPDPEEVYFIFLTLQDEMKNIPGHKQVSSI